MGFGVEEIEKTFTEYKKGKIFEGVVVALTDNGVIFNVGGKKDAFIPKDETHNFENLKIGERFNIIITTYQNEQGFIEGSQIKAEQFLLGKQKAEKLKLGSKFSFVATDIKNGLCSYLGDFAVFVPASEISSKFIHDLNSLKNKQFEAVVTEINNDNKQIIASVKMLIEEENKQKEDLFWKSIFVNKLVEGKVKNIMPYGIFVDIEGVDCFCHISNLSYQKINNPKDILNIGDVLKFKVIEIDRDAKKVALGAKQLQESPKALALKQLAEGEIYKGEVIKILTFGALVKLENSAVGLLHISNLTERKDVNVYEIVKVGDLVDVRVISLDIENEKVSFEKATSN